MSEKESTVYLMETFTPEIARKFSDLLNLTSVEDILNVQDSQINSLDMMDVHKRIFKRIRDQLKQKNDDKVSIWLTELRGHGQ